MPDTEASSIVFYAFVGPLPRKRKAGSFRPALRNALGVYPMLRPDFAAHSQRSFQGVRRHIDRAIACFFEVSNPDCSKTFTQLGYALGRGTPCFLFRRHEAPPLEGFEDCPTVTYKKAADLEEGLRQIKLLPHILSHANTPARPSTPDTKSFLDPALLSAVGEGLVEKNLDPGRIFRIAGNGGFSEEQVLHILRTFASMGLAEEIGVVWHLTEAGKSSLGRLHCEGDLGLVH